MKKYLRKQLIQEHSNLIANMDRCIQALKSEQAKKHTLYVVKKEAK